MEPQTVLQFYLDKGKPIEHYIVAQENHSELPESKSDKDELEPEQIEVKHLHVYLEYASKQALAWSTLDLKDGDITYHGNYQTCRSPERVAAYCIKDGNYLTNFTEEELERFVEVAKHKGKTWADVIKLAKENKPDEAHDLMCHVAPRDAVMGGPRVIESLISLNRKAQAKEQASERKFLRPELMDTWDKAKYSLLFVGRTKLGKTGYALSQFKNPFHCTHTDGLSKFNPKVHDGIVFDDVYFDKRAADFRLHITGVQDDAMLNVKYGNVLLKAGTPRIFVANKWPFGYPIPDELKRRLHCVKIEEDLRVMSVEQEHADVKPEDDFQAMLEDYEDEASEQQEPVYHSTCASLMA